MRAFALSVALAGLTTAEASVEAGTLTTVTAEAPLYDSRPSASGGCDPAGCVAGLTRDGDATTLDSRWSCTPDHDAACFITYTFADPFDIVGLKVAMHKGDERTRTMEIYVDGDLQTSWTSSGTTTAFETIDVGANGQAVEIRGVLADSEWLSITEVEILVDDGGADDDDDEAVVNGTDDDAVIVEAGTLGTVTATAALYDARDSSENGCDPDGCTAELTRDGDLSDGSRWSCASSLGGTCGISYDLGAVRDLSELRLAMYKGATRVRTLEVYAPGLVTTWTSSGTTSGFESIDLSGNSAQYVTVVAVQGDLEWLSILEVEIMVLSDGVAPSPSPTTTTPAPVFAPVGTPAPTPEAQTPEQLFSAKEIGTIGTVTVTADLFDSRTAEDNGCDPSGCTAALTRDGDLAETSRWSCAPTLGGTDSSGCTISYDLGEEYQFEELRLAMHKGTTRQRTVDVKVDGTLVRTWQSSGTTDGFEVVDLTGNDGALLGNLAGSGVSGRVVELTGQLDQTEWLSIIETEIMVYPKNVVTPPPSPSTEQPSAAPSPSTEEPTAMPTGNLAPVGLLPLASTGGDDIDKFHAKDGDMSTSWTCSGNPPEPDTQYRDCILHFNMFSYRRIKQVKIALADGAERAVDMRITADYYGTLGETFVTSSGTTDGFETYEFDAFTQTVAIAGVFSSAGQSISISEVEFVEEVREEEIPITRFTHPYCTSCGLWIDGPNPFEWGSESEEVVDRTLYFILGSYASVSAVELLFPVGETYKFDVELFDDEGDSQQIFAGFESTDQEGWQSFDLTGYDGDLVAEISLTIKGTGSGAPGFQLLDARFIGERMDNPTNTLYVASTYHEYWFSDRYPDFVTNGSSDQKKIMEAICAVKQAEFDGVDCVGGVDEATGEVKLPMGSWFVDGNIFMKSGVYLNGRYAQDYPYYTGIVLQEGAAGKTDIDALVVMDGIKDARIGDLWIRGHYDPETSNDTPAVSGLGSSALSIVGSQNITCLDTEIRFLDGDGLLVRNSQNVNIDAGPYDDQYLPWTIGRSRGTGLVVDSSDNVWVRRHTIYDNGVAGIHITGSNNFTFEATIGDECYGTPCELPEGEGNVGSVGGQQPIEVIVESSTLVTFQDMRVQSANDPVMTISGPSTVSFNNCGFSNVESGTCAIQLLDDLSEVTTGDDPELSLDGSCYIKTAE